MLTSFYPQRVCKPFQARGNGGVGETLQYAGPQPPTLWPGLEGMEAEATYSGLIQLL